MQNGIFAEGKPWPWFLAKLTAFFASIISFQGCRGAVIKHGTHNTGVVSSNPPCITMKTPLARKAMGNNLIKSTSLKILRAWSLVSATLAIEYATQFDMFSREKPVADQRINGTHLFRQLHSAIPTPLISTTKITEPSITYTATEPKRNSQLASNQVRS